MKPKDKAQKYIDEWKEIKEAFKFYEDFEKYRVELLGSWLYLTKECGFKTTSECRRVFQILLNK